MVNLLDLYYVNYTSIHWQKRTNVAFGDQIPLEAYLPSSNNVLKKNHHVKYKNIKPLTQPISNHIRKK